MPNGRWSTTNWRRPGGPLVSGDHAAILESDEFSVFQNCWPSHGKASKRGGTVQQGDAPTAATVRWMQHAYGADSSVALAVRLRLCGTKVQYLTGGAWTDIATITAGTYPVSVTYKNIVWRVDGVNTPAQITIASPPVETAWTTLPSGINPQWVVLHKNRLYYGGDITTPTYVYMTNPGTPGTTTVTDFYQIPDDQRGFFPRIAIDMGDGIGFFAQDYKCFMTGTGPLSHRIYQFEKAQAALYWRTVVSMGDCRAIYLTEVGPFIWDGHSEAQPLDKMGRQNWGAMDLTVNENTHAVRYGDWWVCFYKDKGGSTAAGSGTATQMFSIYDASTRTCQVTIGGVPSPSLAQSSSYIAYNIRTGQWTQGVQGTGGILCAAWEESLYGDTQNLWVGDATTGGKCGKWDQASDFTDYTVPFEMIVKTAGIGDPWMRTSIDSVMIKASAHKDGTSRMSVSVYSNGSVRDPATWGPESVSLSNESGLDGDPQRYAGGDDVPEDFVIRTIPSPYGEGKRSGYSPQIQINDSTPSFTAIYAIAADFS